MCQLLQRKAHSPAGVAGAAVNAAEGAVAAPVAVKIQCLHLRAQCQFPQMHWPLGLLHLLHQLVRCSTDALGRTASQPPGCAVAKRARRLIQADLAAPLLACWSLGQGCQAQLLPRLSALEFYTQGSAGQSLRLPTRKAVERQNKLPARLPASLGRITWLGEPGGLGRAAGWASLGLRALWAKAPPRPGESCRRPARSLLGLV